MRSLVRPLSGLAATFALVLGLVPGASGAQAAVAAPEPLTGPCIEWDPTSPQCAFEYGTVTFVADGDTMDVDVDRSAVSSHRTVLRVRLAGVQAMEQTEYSRYPERRAGLCHSLEATTYLERMAPIGSRVRLAAISLSAMTGKRYRRSIAYRDNGGWVDTGSRILQAGHALWLPNSEEYAWNRHYNYWAQKASLEGQRLWDTDYCGSGPNQGSNLQVWVQSDSSGDLNGEYVRILNRNRSTAVDMSGWFVRDTFLRPMTAAGTPSVHPGFTFPRGTVLAAGKTLTVHVGSGTNTADHFYWRQSAFAFENETGAPTYSGDGGYLFDPQGDLRSWSIWPCLTATLCADPLDGKIRISKVVADAPGDDGANPNGEYVMLTVPATGSPVDLRGYQLQSQPYAYDFSQVGVINPGETLKVSVGSGTSSRLHRFWGRSAGIFNNSGDTVRLANFRGHTISCTSWGSARC